MSYRRTHSGSRRVLTNLQTYHRRFQRKWENETSYLKRRELEKTMDWLEWQIAVFRDGMASSGSQSATGMNSKRAA